MFGSIKYNFICVICMVVLYNFNVQSINLRVVGNGPMTPSGNDVNNVNAYSYASGATSNKNGDATTVVAGAAIANNASMKILNSDNAQAAIGNSIIANQLKFTSKGFVFTPDH